MMGVRARLFLVITSLDNSMIAGAVPVRVGLADLPPGHFHPNYKHSGALGRRGGYGRRENRSG